MKITWTPTELVAHTKDLCIVVWLNKQDWWWWKISKGKRRRYEASYGYTCAHEAQEGAIEAAVEHGDLSR